MSKNLIIVESPTKAKTISHFLNSDYIIESSFGHVRDLPKSKMGIDMDNNFEPEYVVSPKAKANVAKLKKLSKEADVVYFATDEDREGEAIAWHLLELLKPAPDKIKRIVFHEITKTAILEALANPRSIDDNLVHAQEARRLLDRLYGYSVSPLLWQKIKPGLSAGRVQSVATKLLVEREKERMAFKSATFYDIQGIFANNAQASFEANLIKYNNQTIASGKDFADKTGQLINDKVLWLDQVAVNDLVKKLANEPAIVSSLEKKPFTERPYAPFTTSSLQQESNRKLHYSAKRTMQIAQSLYENGYITYMRTDSTALSDQAINAARSWIAEQYGSDYLPDTPRTYQTKVRNAQEAHEAIRPAGVQFTTLEQVAREVADDEYKLYELIWKRTVASQMLDASGLRLNCQINCDGATFSASGKSYTFPGFRRAYVEGSDDAELELAEQEKLLPDLKVGEKLSVIELSAKEHQTLPPARLTEASLVKELESRGIGRPSTYASIIETILRRDYVFKKGTALVPTFTAFIVINLLENYLPKLVSYNFTAKMEDELDEISLGNKDDKEYLKSFYFGENKDGLKHQIEEVKDNIDPRLTSGLTLAEINGQKLEIRVGKFGSFIRYGEASAGLPDTLTPEETTPEVAIELINKKSESDKILGQDPVSKSDVILKHGRFGYYVQLGSPIETLTKTGKKKIIKPKMASLIAPVTPENITIDSALDLLTLPKNLGIFPDNDESIIAANGRFGPYLKAGSETRSLKDISPLEVTLDQAIEILRTPKVGRGRRQAKSIKDFTINGATIKLMEGKYGPYLSNGKKNVTLPKEYSIESLTSEQAQVVWGNKTTKKTRAKKK